MGGYKSGSNYQEQGGNKWVVDGELEINGTLDLNAGFEVGQDDTGFDVKFYGATTGKYFLWDESADKLIIVGSADLGASCEADAYTVGGVAGVDFSGAVTNITVVKGIVTAVS